MCKLWEFVKLSTTQQSWLIRYPWTANYGKKRLLYKQKVTTITDDSHFDFFQLKRLRHKKIKELFVYLYLNSVNDLPDFSKITKIGNQNLQKNRFDIKVDSVRKLSFYLIKWGGENVSCYKLDPGVFFSSKQ